MGTRAIDERQSKSNQIREENERVRDRVGVEEVRKNDGKRKS